MEFEIEVEEYADRIIGFDNEKHQDWLACQNYIIGFCEQSNWIKAEKIKARIEENLSMLEMLKIHGTERTIFTIKCRLDVLKQELRLTGYDYIIKENN
jgi:hypothetical protein